jgi:ribonuclease M5
LILEKLVLRQAILCEGKYDAIRLEALFDTLILPVHGFQIYHNTQRRALLRRLAAQRGVVIATDSDPAGFRLRGYLKGILPPAQTWHVVLPPIPGKEKRKAAPSRAGLLGVEGMDRQTLLAAFAPLLEPAAAPPPGLDPMLLYRDGFAGTPGCQARYQALLARLNLPEHMSAKLFCACVTPEEYERAKATCK